MNNLTDKQLVDRIFAGDEVAIHFFFYERFNFMFRLNALKTGACREGVELDDLIQEFFLYLSSNNWEKLHKYDPKSPLANWLSVVCYRFFKDFARPLIDSTHVVPIDNLDDRSLLSRGNNIISTIMMDIKKAISKLKPPRDKQIMEMLLLDEVEPVAVAKQFNVTVDNLYNIKRRALVKLVQQHLHDYVI